MPEAPEFWSVPVERQLAELETTRDGLSSQDASCRLKSCGANRLGAHRGAGGTALFLAQFKSPITLILIFAAGLSAFLRERADALIILSIILISAVLGFWQEYGAARALAGLLALVKTTAKLLRDGREIEIPLEEVVPGDVTVLSAGGAVPGDCLVLESKDLFVDEATLTGETYPVEKRPGIILPETPLSQRTNSVFLGTHVVSGTARALVIRTGRKTEFGEISQRLQLRPPKTEFERGVRRFGYLLMEVTLLLVVAIFAVNVALSRPVMDSFLFSLALAVGLTPQLLPAIISVNLAHGAKRMAERGVIVRRLASIENFGSMDVLCTDKTGTITLGAVQVHAAVNATGDECENVLRYAFFNATFETGFVNPIDAAIRRHRQFDMSGTHKLDEIPYDFLRKRLSILITDGGEHLLVTKGAVSSVLEVCSTAAATDGTTVPLAHVREGIDRLFLEHCGRGFRALGVACKRAGSQTLITKDDERDMTFLGLLILSDPVKPNIRETIEQLNGLGISLKMITGDNRLVAANIAAEVGFGNGRLLTGADLRTMGDAALIQQVDEVGVFAEIEPNQKERIILALQKAAHVVGYLGDGINDASALHAADVGISVDQAVDVAKEAADIVLLEHDLGVLVQGVREGRSTFANTLKYVYMATSANFGNMFSMAGASLVLPFLPMLPKQILLTNLLTDFPEMTIATDNVDPELVARPRRWDIRSICRFMLIFGTLSSVFDYLTFAALWYWVGTDLAAFRTGWFIESVVSATLIVLVIRSRRPAFRSRPSLPLATATLLVVSATAIVPWTPVAELLGFKPLPPGCLAVLAGIIVAYVLSAEIAKKLYFRRLSR